MPTFGRVHVGEDLLDPAKLGDCIHSVCPERVDELVFVILRGPVSGRPTMPQVCQLLISRQRRHEIRDTVNTSASGPVARARWRHQKKAADGLT
jgi:hypothetical protein